MRRAILAAVVGLTLAACGGTGGGDTPPETAPPVETTTVVATYPVTVAATNGDVTITERPGRIVSLSPALTEIVFAVGAGDQVRAVDELSTFPAEAPVTDLSGFTPNVEAIVAQEPDLVILSDDIDGVVGTLEGLDIPVLHLAAAPGLDEVYAQIEAVGAATGHPGEAAALVDDMKTEIKAVVDPTVGSGLTYYHELDPTALYSVTSQTFIGQLYGLFGLENVADAADPNGESGGYPQLSEEYIVESDPDFIFVTDCCGDTAQSVAERPGWEDMTAVRSNSIVVFDDDISSRWGPRVVEFVRGIARAIEEKNPT
jgi:iron complex transport system substrate-binding protein